ncbi:hypothetical protein [Caulobacter sp. Root1472]|jgi:predicted histidine transporter YuiF (NhaC family)|uniref:hypothetical protein n=1 Tax=Caulobacter sp. Root1472 TaxID=1736470 RepID=UPI0006F71AAF|nr:hypothetical protein [Caulobacter sp. Root1472]
MTQELLATRLARRCRLPIVALALVSAALVAGNLLSLVLDGVVTYLAVGVGCAAAILFCCATFDGRFQNAVSALNAERRVQAKTLGALARSTGWGLPVGDRLLLAVNIMLIAELTVSASFVHRLPAAALSFAASFLVCMTSIALAVRGYSSERFEGP